MTQILIGAAALTGLAPPSAFFVIAPSLVEQIDEQDRRQRRLAGVGAAARRCTSGCHRRSPCRHAAVEAPLDEASDRGHVDLPRLEAGNVALQVFSSVTKTPKGQNYEANSDKTDNITMLAVAQLQPINTWDSGLLERSLWHAEKLAPRRNRRHRPAAHRPHRPMT